MDFIRFNSLIKEGQETGVFRTVIASEELVHVEAEISVSGFCDFLSSPLLEQLAKPTRKKLVTIPIVIKIFFKCTIFCF